MLELYFLKKWPLSPENLNIDTTCKATKTLAIFLGWHSIRGFVASSLIRLKTINHTWTYQVGLNSHENFELKPLLNCSRILRLTSAATSISRYLLVWLVTFNLTLPSRLHEGVARKTFFYLIESLVAQFSFDYRVSSETETVIEKIHLLTLYMKSTAGRDTYWAELESM